MSELDKFKEITEEEFTNLWRDMALKYVSMTMLSSNDEGIGTSYVFKDSMGREHFFKVKR